MLFCFDTAVAQKASYKQAESKPLFNPATNCQLRYYYFPNTEAYFDTFKRVYYYRDKGEWITAEEIPDGYRGYSVYNKINVYITDYDDDYPCQFIEIHKKKFPYVHNERTKKMLLSQN